MSAKIFVQRKIQDNLLFSLKFVVYVVMSVCVWGAADGYSGKGQRL
jgi:hypothetical protein